MTASLFRFSGLFKLFLLILSVYCCLDGLSLICYAPSLCHLGTVPTDINSFPFLIFFIFFYFSLPFLLSELFINIFLIHSFCNYFFIFQHFRLFSSNLNLLHLFSFTKHFSIDFNFLFFFPFNLLAHQSFFMWFIILIQNEIYSILSSYFVGSRFILEIIKTIESFIEPNFDDVFIFVFISNYKNTWLKMSLIS